jgi:RNA polymerase sigma-70 factor (ECF subfamily)
VEDRDDDALMVLAAGDHRRAFEVLVARHLPALTGYCAKFLGSAHAGEEVAQDVMVEAWSLRARYRAQGRLRVFLLSIARTRCLNRLRDDGRRARRTPPADEPGESVVATGTPADQLDELLVRERQRRVREALQALPPKLREALLLRFDHGLDYAEMASIARRPEVTMRSRVFHALRQLRAGLAREELP